MTMGWGFPELVGAPPQSRENSPDPLRNRAGAGSNFLPGARVGAGENSSPSPSPFPCRVKFSVFIPVLPPRCDYEL